MRRVATASHLARGSGTPEPKRLRVEPSVTHDGVKGVPTDYPHLVVRAQVNGVDGDKWQRAGDQAAAFCPVSRLLASARISVEALLDPT